MASKFALRWRDKHLFNPSCFALVALLAASDRVWVSAGQWGAAALFGFAVAGLGLLVLFHTARSDVTWAVLAFHASLALGRSLWLGEPLAIPLHGLRSGGLLLFAFFMISDPRTIPDSRPGRILFAALVALGAFAVQFGLREPNPLLWSLAGCAPLVPLLDRLLPGPRYAWASGADPSRRKENPMRRLRRPAVAAALVLGLALPWDALAFCGFYVAKADTKLFNRASQVVLVRDGDRSVLSMSNDFQGEPKEFAMVVPVPTFIERGQIHVGERAVIEHLDAYTSPRLVEYFDPDPCAVYPQAPREALRSLGYLAQDRVGKAGRASGVRIEARYTVGEYDILILSADESQGLAGWLRENGYRLPDGAEPVLHSYIKQGMRFFVARVNLEEHASLGYAYLRPLQVAYESPKFMLPIRLGTLNADGAQELFVYTLTRKGRVETTNYRTVKLATGMELPSFVKGEFGDFYTALFAAEVRRQDMRAVFTEYAWDMNGCDPCAADPLSPEELRGLGVFWLAEGGGAGPAGQARDVFVTRLHVRYDAGRFPADLVFQETGDRGSFQGRYVLRHPFAGETACPAADAYWQQVRERQEQEAQTLARLTGWDLAEIRRKAGLDVPWVRHQRDPDPWWRTLWN